MNHVSPQRILPRFAWVIGLMLTAFMARLGAADAPGLRVSADGRWVLAGRPFRGVGVNYYDLFVRSLEASTAVPPEVGLAQLAEKGIPFARFSAGGYWPIHWGLYQTNRTEYFARLDRVVQAAERLRIGLIPSLFWHGPTIPDLVAEPHSAWGDPRSRTCDLMRQYTREVVLRYRASPAVWAWEFGNEHNLPADLPNAADHRPPVVPALGTPAIRTARDEITHEHMRTAVREFAREVRRHDPDRAILSGHAFPRPTAWHQQSERSWKRDSEEQWSAMLAGDNPDPVNTLSGRLYAESDSQVLPWAVTTARRLKKPLFVGEFGVPGDWGPENRRKWAALVDQLTREQVDLAALWVFDFEGQASDWSVTVTNARSGQLEAAAELNRKWQTRRAGE